MHRLTIAGGDIPAEPSLHRRPEAYIEEEGIMSKRIAIVGAGAVGCYVGGYFGRRGRTSPD